LLIKSAMLLGPVVERWVQVAQGTSIRPVSFYSSMMTEGPEQMHF